MQQQPKIVVVGSLNMDLVVETDRAPQLGETVMGNDVHFIPGGKGANQAVAAARLGAETRMVGAVGNDAFGIQLVKAMHTDRVDVTAIKVVPGSATGVASIVLAQDDNSIVVVPGANYQCTLADIDQQKSHLADADVLLLQLEIPLQTVVHAAEVAKRHGTTVILNPAPAQVLPPELLRNVDYITPNRSELALLTSIDPDGEQLAVAMQRLLALGCKHVITTLGSQGAAYMQEDEQLHHVTSFQVPVVDTTGAGDAFNAGLAYSLAAGNSLADAVTFASQVSALAVTRLGAQSGMPTMQEVANFTETVRKLPSEKNRDH